jgi:Sec-independent protein translocase protein TatA
VGFGSEILFVLALGLVVLGPKRLQTLLGQVARAKAQLEEAGRGVRSQLGAELDLAARDAKTKGPD